MTNSILIIPFLFLLVVSVTIDIRLNRIPNWLTLTILIAGLYGQFLNKGFEGLSSGLIGMATGLACFLPFYLKGGMGAGDVKLMASVGSFLGAKFTLLAAAYTLVAGGLMALVIVLSTESGKYFLARYLKMARLAAGTGKIFYFPPDENEVGKIRFAYAAAIATGTILVLYQYYPTNTV